MNRIYRPFGLTIIIFLYLCNVYKHNIQNMKTIYMLLFVAFIGIQPTMAQKVQYRTMPREQLENLEKLRAKEYDDTQTRMKHLKNRMNEIEKSHKELKKQYNEQKKLSSQQKKELKAARTALKLRDKLKKINN